MKGSPGLVYCGAGQFLHCCPMSCRSTALLQGDQRCMGPRRAVTALWVGEPPLCGLLLGGHPWQAHQPPLRAMMQSSSCSMVVNPHHATISDQGSKDPAQIVASHNDGHAFHAVVFPPFLSDGHPAGRVLAHGMAHKPSCLRARRAAPRMQGFFDTVQLGQCICS